MPTHPDLVKVVRDAPEYRLVRVISTNDEPKNVVFELEQLVSAVAEEIPSR